MKLYRSFLVRDYGSGIFLANILETRLEELQACEWQIVSVTPHVVHRGKSDEYLEYIIVATAKIDDAERKENIKVWINK